jgi:hypothetical protein
MRVLDQMLLVTHPAIGAVLLAEAIFGGMPALLEQERLLGLDRFDVVRMHARAPEVGVLQIFIGTIAEQPLDILADEGRRVVAARPEAVDHSWRGFEQEGEPRPRLVLGLFGRFTRSDIAPRAHDLDRLSLLVTHEVLLVIDPAIGTVLAAEAIFERVLTFLEQIADLGLDPREIFGVHALAPEIGIVEIFADGIAEQARDVVADEDRREIVLGLEAVDHSR